MVTRSITLAHRLFSICSLQTWFLLKHRLYFPFIYRHYFRIKHTQHMYLFDDYCCTCFCCQENRCSAQFYPLYMPRRLWNTICDYYHYVTWMYLMNEIFGKTWKSLIAFSNNTWKSFSIQVESSYNHWLLSRLMKCLWMTYSLFFGFFLQTWFIPRDVYTNIPIALIFTCILFVFFL